MLKSFFIRQLPSLLMRLLFKGSCGHSKMDYRTLVGLGTALTTTSVITYLIARSRMAALAPSKWIKVGTVKEFRIFPVKSLMGIEVEEATATKIGFQSSEYIRDRVFIVVDPDGVLIRQSDEPRMALYQVDIEGNKVKLSGPDTSTVEFEIPEDRPELRRSCTIWGEIVKEALDCGEEVNGWLTEQLGRPVKLLYHFRTVTCRPALTKDHQRFSTFSVQDKGTFQDDTSYMFTTQESLDELNKNLPASVTSLRFRPNIVIEGTPEAFCEDHWRFVRIGGEGGPIFKVAQPCLRCRLTLVNPETGTIDPKGYPLNTLHKLKHNLDGELKKACKGKAVYGTQLGLYEAGQKNVKLGDVVHVALL